MPRFVGDRVRQARALRWRSSKDLAEVLGWSAPKLSRVEQADEIDIGEREALLIGHELGFPANFFLLPADPPLLESDLLFRAPKRTTKREKVYLAEFARLTSLFISKLDEQHRLPPVRLPFAYVDSCNGVSELARRARESMQVGATEPIGHLTHQVERAGVVIVVRPNGLSPEDEDRFDDAAGNRKSEVHYGYSTWVGQFRERPLIVMRATASWERSRWTIAHELGHLLMHRENLDANAEEEASRFAGELLAPAAAVELEIVRPVTLAGLIPVKKKWGISLGALLPHLWHSGVITRERFEALRTQLYTRINPETGRTWGYDEPGWQDREAERPRLLSAWAERCFGSSSPKALNLVIPELPRDLISEMLREQRTAPRSSRRNVVPPRGVKSASVHSLEQHRRRS